MCRNQLSGLIFHPYEWGLSSDQAEVKADVAPWPCCLASAGTRHAEITHTHPQRSLKYALIKAPTWSQVCWENPMQRGLIMTLAELCVPHGLFHGTYLPCAHYLVCYVWLNKRITSKALEQIIRSYWLTPCFSSRSWVPLFTNWRGLALWFFN